MLPIINEECIHNVSAKDFEKETDPQKEKAASEKASEECIPEKEEQERPDKAQSWYDRLRNYFS